MQLELLTRMNNGSEGLKILGVLCLVILILTLLALLVGFIARQFLAYVEKSKQKEANRQKTYNDVVQIILNSTKLKERYFGGLSTRSVNRR